MGAVLVGSDPSFSRLKGDVACHLNVDMSVNAIRLRTPFNAARDVRDLGLICDFFAKPGAPLVELGLFIFNVEHGEEPVICCCPWHRING